MHLISWLCRSRKRLAMAKGGRFHDGVWLSDHRSIWLLFAISGSWWNSGHSQVEFPDHRMWLFIIDHLHDLLNKFDWIVDEWLRICKESVQDHRCSWCRTANDRFSQMLLSQSSLALVENKNRFCQKFTRSYLTQNENARFTKCQNQWPHSVWSLFGLHSTVCPAAGQQLHTATPQNKNKDVRCHILTLHSFTRFHLEPRV